MILHWLDHDHRQIETAGNAYASGSGHGDSFGVNGDGYVGMENGESPADPLRTPRWDMATGVSQLYLLAQILGEDAS